MKRQAMFQYRIATAGLLPAVALALSAPAASAQAQSPGSVNDFQLPPGDALQPPPAAGPVDPEQPVPVQGAPAPVPAPGSAPRPDTGPPPVVATQSPPQPAVMTAPPRTAGKTASVPPADAAVARIPPGPATFRETPAAVQRGTPSSPSAGASPVLPDAAPPGDGFPWAWWLLGGVPLALLSMAAIFGLRRKVRSRKTGYSIQSEDSASVDKPTAPPIEPAVSPLPVPSGHIQFLFEPEQLTMALVNARLAYRLSLTNSGESDAGPVTVACDIISAHASIGGREQLQSGGEGMEPKHRLHSIAPGETLSLAGELKLPVAAILPVRSGGVSLFVPLARFRLTVQEEGRAPLVSTRIFVIGESPAQPGMRLKPIRIDAGPRTFSRIGQREIKEAA